MNGPGSTTNPVVPAFLSGGGELGALMRAHDWSTSPLGEPTGWPAPLKMSVSICLNSRFPMVLWWGADFVMLYNDAWRPVLGETKHPGGLGRPGVESWPEIWNVIGDQLAGVMRGEASWSEDLLLVLERYGYKEEAYFTYSYSPIKDEAGAIRGVFSAVNETTERVVGGRRMAVLRDLAERTADAKSIAAACEVFAGVLGENHADLPFALLYVADGARIRRVALTGIDPDDPRAPAQVAADGDDPWRIAAVVRTGSAAVLDDLTRRFGELPGGMWPEPTTTAFVMPVAKAGEALETTAVLVAGINPRRPLDESYKGFLKLVAGHMVTAIGNARTYEEERRRAEALAEIDRAKTAFFSNISHEFRTPLTLMLAPLEDALADGEASPATQHRRLAIAHRNALRLLRLVNSLLDFSRIEAGRLEAVYQPTDLAALTAELASSFRSATDKAGLALTVDCPPLGETAFVDHDMWEKVVLNLLSNAFKFTLEGEIAVSLSAAGGVARLAVRDTGSGIPADAIPRLFERFHRVEGTKGRSFEGSGIGLALVHELVKQHGGAIAVESDVGRGSVFVVDIPLGSAHLPSDRVRPVAAGEIGASRALAFVEEALRWLPDQAANDALLDTAPLLDPPVWIATEPHAKRPRVLLADDNADLRSYIARLLVEHGYDVETAADGEVALAAVRAARPDLIVTDVMMPQLDGFGLLRAIRDEASLRDLPVIMLSARAGEEAKVEGLGAGADDYLTKPFSARELVARVAANLAMARLRKDNEAALREVNATLERRVEERTAELLVAEDALRQAQKMEAVGQLTGGIAHDFNNLLTIVLGNVDIARRALASAETSRAMRAMDNAQKGAERAAALTHRLLAFSRRQPLEPKPTNADKLIAGMAELLHRALGELVSLEVVSTPKLWRVEIDPNQLENALLNLAVNARDAMPAGGKLTIETANARLDDSYSAQHAEVVPGNYVVIAVTDTGRGMSKETLARVFEPFFTTKEVGKGTGLGLSMVYGFVKQSGGHVKVYSEADEGTTVKLYLPRLMSEADPADDVEIQADGAGDRSSRILVVEDDDDVRAYTVEILREIGYRVLEAHDGPAALRLLGRQETEIDLLFTDVVMPGMSGRDLAEAARGIRPSLKILYTSGYTRNAIVHGGRLDPGVEMIAKPFTYQSLAQKVRDALDVGQAGRLLVVEDDATVRMLAVEALMSLGYAVDEAATSSEAINRVRSAQGRYAAVVMDVGLPGKTGDAVAVELRAMHMDLPILLASGEHEAELRERFKSDRCIGVIGKPYNAARLQAALKTLGVRCQE